VNDELLFHFKKNLGNRVKYLRQQKGMTQQQLAALLNVDFQSISRLENGRVNPSAYFVKLLAEALDVEIKEIFNFSFK
jgi:putative transcriptional regulator